MTAGLHERLLSAHADTNRNALVALYTEAAEAANDLDTACFFLTHAYIFALDAGDPRAPALHARLMAEGREA